MSRLFFSQKFSSIKNHKNAIKAGALTGVLVLASCPALPVSALEIDPIEIDEVIVEETENILPSGDLLINPTSSLLGDFSPVASTSSTTFGEFICSTAVEPITNAWCLSDSYTSKHNVLKQYKLDQNESKPIKLFGTNITISTENNPPFTQVLRNGDGEKVGELIYDTSNNTLTVTINEGKGVDDVVIRTIINHDNSNYEYYRIPADGNTYTISFESNGAWLVGLGTPVTPPTYDYVCKVDEFAVNLNVKTKTVTVTVGGESRQTAGTPVTTLPAVVGYKIDFGDGSGYHYFDKDEAISYTYQLDGEYKITAQVVFDNEETTKNKSDANCSETIIIEPGKGKIDPPAAGIHEMLAGKDVNTIAWFNIALGLVMTGAALTGFAIVRLLSKEDLTQ